MPPVIRRLFPRKTCASSGDTVIFLELRCLDQDIKALLEKIEQELEVLALRRSSPCRCWPCPLELTVTPRSTPTRSVFGAVFPEYSLWD